MTRAAKKRNLLLSVAGLLLVLVLYVASYAPMHIYFVWKLSYSQARFSSRPSEEKTRMERRAAAVTAFYAPLVAVLRGNKAIGRAFAVGVMNPYSDWEARTFDGGRTHWKVR